MSMLNTIKGWGRADDADTRRTAARPSAWQSMQTAAPSTYPSAHTTMAGDIADTTIGEDTASADATPSELQEFVDSQPAIDLPAARTATGLPLIGRRPVANQQRILVGMVAAGFVGLVVLSTVSLISGRNGAIHSAAAGQALMQSQRLAKSVSLALVGRGKAFAEVRESSDALVRSVATLHEGGMAVSAAPASVQSALAPVLPLVARAQKNAGVVLEQQQVLQQVGRALRAINAQSSDLLKTAEAIAAQKLAANASPAEISAVGQLVMLTQRIGKSANEFLTVDGLNADAGRLLGSDLDTFRATVQDVADGNRERRLPPTRDATTLANLARLAQQYDQMRARAVAIVGNPARLIAAREAQSVIVADSEPLRQGLELAQQRLGSDTGFNLANIGLLFVSVVVLLGGVTGLLRLYVQDQRQRAEEARRQQLEAEREQRESKRVNDANQAAILRLMNELQSVAEGDLTQQATVTEDITGAIADSVNYTIEELRTLVAQVQGTVARVHDTTQQVDSTSTELLAASTEQLREIRDTGESVLQMAGRINEVSANAQETAQVARQSLDAAESGLRAVQDTIGGMHSIREQIQDTSKRIKRLGESSQEIGEITELISDITEQTNVLALNAAIQAASAGDAGRGFSVVAEEVQRLAERSGDATRQIATLVKAIQADTQDAVAAMERSTQGVVEGTRLSDAAGAALGDIDRVSRQLAELIAQISAQALSEADSANVVAANIQHIFAVTEQTGEGTQSTAQMVRELAKTAEELTQSVARFKIA